MVLKQFFTRKFARLRKPEAIVVFFISVALLVFITDWDITMHDTYVLPLVSNCIPENQDPLPGCKIFTERGKEGMEIGRPYWDRLFILAVLIAAIPSVFRALIGSPAAGFIWFVSIIAMPFSGAEDWYYYTVRDLKIPETLPWLNEQVFISWTRFFTNTNDVVVAGLGLSILTAVIIVVALWYLGLKFKMKGSL